jgi:hypothetical protein
MRREAKTRLRERILQNMAEGCIQSWIEFTAVRQRMHRLPFDGALAQRGRLDYYPHAAHLLHEHRVNVMMTRAVKDSWK